MTRSPLAVFCVCALFAITAPTAAAQSSDPIGRRVEGLLQQMTLEEKVGQMTQLALQSVSSRPGDANTRVQLDSAKLEDALVKRHGLRVGRCGLPVLALLLTAVFLVFGSMAESAGVATIVLAGGAGAIYLAQSAYWSVTADFAGVHTGVVSGVMNMGCQIGGAITASLTPWIASQLGWTSAFMVAAGLAVIGALAWLFVDPRRTLRID